MISYSLASSTKNIGGCMNFVNYKELKWLLTMSGRYCLAFVALALVSEAGLAKDLAQGPSLFVIDSGFPEVIVMNTKVIGDGRWQVAEDRDTGTRLMVSVTNGKLNKMDFVDKYGKELGDGNKQVDECAGGIIGGVPQCLVNPSNPGQNPFICSRIPVDFEQCVCACAN
jgi:hypothetical protein